MIHAKCIGVILMVNIDEEIDKLRNETKAVESKKPNTKEEAREFIINDMIKEFGHIDENNKFKLYGEFFLAMEERGILKEEYDPLIEKERIKREKDNTKKDGIRKEILLPSLGRLASDFAIDVADAMKGKNGLYYRPSSKEIIEITQIKEKDKLDEYIGFSGIRPERFITLIEKYIVPCVKIQSENGVYIKEKSMSVGYANILLSSPALQNSLPKIERIFPVPIPIIYENKLTFPRKGYDERFNSYMPKDAPEINEDITLDKAKEIICGIYNEFCFQEKQDYVNAVSALLTPFIRGLFSSFSIRTPVFFYTANRERAGKDYCADITGLVMEGYSLSEPPISSGEGFGNNNEELRKKLLSACMAGRKRLHFGNNKGYIDNAVFEGVITSEKISDRALGRNEILNFDNEIDFSLSGNVGIGFTPDLANRSKFVRLFLDIEDANARKFNNPNLHGWVKSNRELIISALYALVKNWFNSGCPKGTIPFASFPEWSNICGGIMECAGLGNPCLKDKESLSVGGDVETNDMRSLFELCYNEYGENWITKFQIKQVVEQAEDLFAYLDFGKRADQTKFGQKITRFVGRVLSDIVLKVKDPSVRASRQEFKFTKEKVSKDKSEIFGNLGNLGNLSYLYSDFEQKFNIGIETLPTLPRLPKEGEK